MGLTMLSLLLALQNSVPRDHLGIATSVAQFSRSIGGTIGVSIMGAIVAASLPAGGESDPAAMAEALHRAFLSGAVFVLFALATAFRIPATELADGTRAPSSPNKV